MEPLTTGNAGCWRPEKRSREAICQQLQSPLGSTSPGKLLLFPLELRQSSIFKVKIESSSHICWASDQERQRAEPFLSHWFLEGSGIMGCQWVQFSSSSNTSLHAWLTSFAWMERWIHMSLFIVSKQRENLPSTWYCLLHKLIVTLTSMWDVCVWLWLCVCMCVYVCARGIPQHYCSC